MPQVELTRGEYGLEGEIRLPAWEHWQIQEQAQPIRVDFGGDRVEEGQELTEKLPHGAGLPVCWAGADPKCHFEGRFWSIWHNSGTTF